MIFHVLMMHPPRAKLRLVRQLDRGNTNYLYDAQRLSMLSQQRLSILRACSISPSDLLLYVEAILTEVL